MVLLPPVSGDWGIATDGFGAVCFPPPNRHDIIKWLWTRSRRVDDESTAVAEMRGARAFRLDRLKQWKIALARIFTALKTRSEHGTLLSCLNVKRTNRGLVPGGCLSAKVPYVGDDLCRCVRIARLCGKGFRERQ